MADLKAKEKISLGDHFTFKKIIKFTMPTILMNIFCSIYGVIDGFFVSNFAGKVAFAGINLIFPFLTILWCIGFMFGSGGSALIAKTMGEGKKEEANEQFSLIVYASIIVTSVFAVVGYFIMEKAGILLGAEGQLLTDSVTYGRILMFGLPFQIVQFEFQSFFITAEKPKIGLYSSILAGVTNVLFDYLLTAVFPYGIVGAGVATTLSQVVGALFPLIYFAKENNSPLKLGKTKFHKNVLFKTVTNGSSELMSNVTMAVVGILYNYQLMKYAGENGIAAFGAVMYVSMIFYAIYYGFSSGIAPAISYHFGAKNRTELRSLLKQSLIFIVSISVVMFVTSELSSDFMARAYTSYDEELLKLTKEGFFIYSFTYIFAGISVFGSAFFTALNNGLISALISFLRSSVFQIIAVLVLPLIFGMGGIWASIVVAESCAFIMTVSFIFGLKKKYGYGKELKSNLH